MRHIPLSAIREAASIVYQAAIRTPLVRLEFPSQSDSGPEVFLKLECLQPIGSFKIRGAWNAVRSLPADVLREGVWTVSAGNAAQGVAFAARKAGAPCSVMVMDTAPETKLRSVEKLGATIVKTTYDECWRTVEQHKSDRMRGTFVHPFDDDRFIAGNGTAGLEILEDLPDVDAIVAPLGGGGLLAGIGAAVRALKPDVKIFAAEPETASPLALSFERGEPSYFPTWTPSFVDGAGGKSVLPTMWPLLKQVVDQSIVVSLDEARAAMKRTVERVHVVAEGAAACAVAASLRLADARSGQALRLADAPPGQGLNGRARPAKIVAVVSGGNIDLAKFAKLIDACP